MRSLNRFFRAVLALALLCLPALTGRAGSLRAAAPEPVSADKAELASAAEADLNAVEEDKIQEAQGSGKETFEEEGDGAGEEDAADELAEAELDMKEVDDDADEILELEGREAADPDIEAEIDGEHDLTEEDLSDMEEISELDNETEGDSESGADDKGERIETEDSGVEEAGD